MPKQKTAIVWFRNDLRVDDNPALDAAIECGYKVLPLYIFHEGKSDDLKLGGASKWWLHHALTDLENQLGSLTLLKSENLTESIIELAQEVSADAVFWNRRYEPEAIQLDSEVKDQLKQQGFTVESFTGNLLNEPHEIKNKSGKPFQVFTPYWKHCSPREVPQPTLKKVFQTVSSQKLSIDGFNLLPNIPWDENFYPSWNPTRQGALEKIAQLRQSKAKNYSQQRDIPSVDGTSTLSPWLHFGQISVRELYHALKDLGEEVHKGYLRQLYWRDFAHHLLFHFPHSTVKSLRPEYDLFPWTHDEQLVEKWRRGQTGYPIIDAGMRQLWQTGWMHNRVRMIVASFLVKHLLQDWRIGLEWFADTLVDADLANNVMGWQWVAGCGADAAPYFRIFNPIMQGEKFDPDGDYVKKYVPELAKVPKKYIHCPWDMEPMELSMGGVTLGKNYPEPIIAHKDGRDQAMEAYQAFKAKRES